MPLSCKKSAQFGAVHGHFHVVCEGILVSVQMKKGRKVYTSNSLFITVSTGPFQCFSLSSYRRSRHWAGLSCCLRRKGHWRNHRNPSEVNRFYSLVWTPGPPPKPNWWIRSNWKNRRTPDIISGDKFSDLFLESRTRERTHLVVCAVWNTVCLFVGE